MREWTLCYWPIMVQWRNFVSMVKKALVFRNFQEKFCCVEFIVVSKFISCKVCNSYQCTGENLEETVLVYSKFRMVTKKNNENFNKLNYICMCLLYVFLMHVKCTTHFILLNFFTQISVNNTNYEATHWAVLSSLLLHFAFILCAGVCGETWKKKTTWKI
jgi:hypothetical protein